jgi:hypothetical protein
MAIKQARFLRHSTAVNKFEKVIFTIENFKKRPIFLNIILDKSAL